VVLTRSVVIDAIGVETIDGECEGDMNEQSQHEDDQDPEPTKHADAQRITDEEAKSVPTSDRDQPGNGSSEPAPEAD
jgi:hypothetical protein